MSGKTQGLPERLRADAEYIGDVKTSTTVAQCHKPDGSVADDVALAAEIARRWNAHEELKAALRECVERFSESLGGEDMTTPERVVFDSARTLLARLAADGGSAERDGPCTMLEHSKRCADGGTA